MNFSALPTFVIVFFGFINIFVNLIKPDKIKPSGHWLVINFCINLYNFFWVKDNLLIFNIVASVIIEMS